MARTSSASATWRLFRCPAAIVRRANRDARRSVCFTRRSDPRPELARCDCVDLGLELEYEVAGMGLLDGVVGRLVGPTRAGQVVTVEVPAPPTDPRVLARLLDEDGRPLAHASIEWQELRTIREPESGGTREATERIAKGDVAHVE